MAEKHEGKVSSTLGADSMKVIAESIGIAGLPDDAASQLAEDVSYRLKLLIQVSFCDRLSRIVFIFKGTVKI